MCFHARLSRVDDCWCYLCRLAGFTHAEVLMSCHATSVLWRARQHALSKVQDNVDSGYDQQYIPWKMWGEMVNFFWANFIPSPDSHKLTPRLPWAYCEFPRDIGVRIWRKGRGWLPSVVLVAFRSVSLESRYGEGLNPEFVALPTSTKDRIFRRQREQYP